MDLSDLETMDDDDLIYELEDRGYVVTYPGDNKVSGFDTNDLKDELEWRGFSVYECEPENLHKMFHKFRRGEDVSEELRNFFWEFLGLNV